jgi:hypothetical protein
MKQEKKKKKKKKEKKIIASLTIHCPLQRKVHYQRRDGHNPNSIPRD